MAQADHQQSKLEALLEAAPDAIITINQDGIIQSVNRSASLLFEYGREEFRDRNVSFLMPEPFASNHDGYIRHYRRTGEKRIIGIGREVTGKRKSGTTFPMHLSVSEYRVDGKTFFTGIIHDLTPRKRVEAALQRSQKMEAIGQLTGGIAHDFNNLLTVITGNLELLEMQLADASHIGLLREAQDAAELGAELTNRLLAFSSRSVLDPEIVNINGLVDGLASILRRILPPAVELEMSLAEGLWDNRADPGQVENAILNLAVNARDAMPGQGELIIETGNVVIEDDYNAREIGLEPGHYVRLSVSDTGTGMDEKTVGRVFEPFFTTKETGKGTGLGLSMVYGFARQSGGHVTLYSELGLGTTFNLYLPRHRQDDGSQRSVAGETRGTILPGGGELILVVEDDPKVRNLTDIRLQALNYRTVLAQNGAEALAALADNSSIDLVLTDIVMPGGMSGYELAEEVRKRYPAMKLLLTSGYPEDLVHRERIQGNGFRMLRKPYKQADLSRLLKEVLAGPT